MILPIHSSELSHADEPTGAREYADLLTQVAARQQAIVVRRNGADIAAVIPLDHLELLHDALLRKEAEELAGKIDWNQKLKDHPPAQAWFDGDEPKPF